jgi:hypothetical protein
VNFIETFIGVLVSVINPFHDFFFAFLNNDLHNGTEKQNKNTTKSLIIYKSKTLDTIF